MTTKKVTSKPVYTEKIVFGSLEHRKLAAAHHYGLVPWLIFHTAEDANATVKRLRMSDSRKAAEAAKAGTAYTPRSVSVCKLADGSEGYGVFFQHTVQA